MDRTGDRLSLSAKVKNNSWTKSRDIEMASFIFYSSKSYNKVESKISQCLAPTLFGTEIIWYWNYLVSQKKKKKKNVVRLRGVFLCRMLLFFSLWIKRRKCINFDVIYDNLNSVHYLAGHVEIHGFKLQSCFTGQLIAVRKSGSILPLFIFSLFTLYMRTP